MMKGDTVLPLGSFEVKSGKLIVSDPCYDRGVLYAGEVGAANGEWFAAARLRTYHYSSTDYKKKFTDTRVRELLAWTAPVVWKGNQLYGGGPWDPLSFVVGVDSGQAGIFDDKAYRDDRYGKELLEKQTKAGEATFDLGYARKDSEPGYWYWAVCNLTLKGDQYGAVLKGGCCVRSGFGDGSYGAFGRHTNGKIVAIKIVFINVKEH